MATTILTLAFATVVVGVFLATAARTKAVTVCQYVPLPIVGAYLAYLGLFLLKSGLALAGGVQLSRWENVRDIDWLGASVKVLPALGALLLLLPAIRRFKHPLVFPALLAGLPAIFFVVWCGVLGKSIDDGRKDGWILP